MDQNNSDTNMPARYLELTKMVEGMMTDFMKFYSGGNKAAGTRVRQAMQELKVFAQSVRTEVQTMKGGSTATSSGDTAEA
jgi:hypothetical protein